MYRNHAHSRARWIGSGFVVTIGACAAALAGSPVAGADTYDLQPIGPGTVVTDTGFPDLYASGTVTQEIAEIDDTTGQVATGAQAGSLDVTEHIFTSPFGSVAFIDGADAAGGTGVYAADAGNASAYDLVFSGPFGGVSEYGNIPLDQIDYTALTNSLTDSAAATVPTDDFGLSGLGAEGFTHAVDSLLSLF